MRFVSILFACVLSGCTYPYPIAVSAGGFEIPPMAKREALTDKGARVSVVNEPPACAMIGLATGVGGVKDVWSSSGDSEAPKYREGAIVALRNVVGERGGTHVVIDATVHYGRVDRWGNVLLRGRAYRC
jgi:hypothetical protein